jgi:hypothetical protein
MMQVVTYGVSDICKNLLVKRYVGLNFRFEK